MKSRGAPTPARIAHGLFEIVNLHHTKMIRLSRELHSVGDFVHSYVCVQLDQHGSLFATSLSAAGLNQHADEEQISGVNENYAAARSSIQ